METNKEYLARLLPLLKKPIPSQWRVQSFSKKKAQATVMSYIDQRDLMDVLDAYCEYGWQKKYEEISGNLFCYIGINMPDGTTHWRSDCGVESQADKEKGQASDAAKRAGVNWGVGRFLYEMGVEYVTASAIKTNDNWPYCIDEQGKQIWDLDKYINDRLAKQGKGVIPQGNTTVKIDHAQRLKDAQDLVQLAAEWALVPKERQVEFLAIKDGRKAELQNKIIWKQSLKH